MLQKIIHNLTFIAVFAIAYSHCFELQSEPQWNFLMFSVSWPSTSCMKWKHYDKGHSCTEIAKLHEWSIHGLWPSNQSKDQPFYCNRTWNFDPEKIKPIESELLTYWQTIEGGMSPYNFWAHEWSKHGTCAAQLPQLNSELKYFQTGLEFLKSYNVTEIFMKNGIHPMNSEGYYIETFYKAISNAFSTPIITCYYQDGNQYINEIHLCFDKQYLKLIPCDDYSYISLSGSPLWPDMNTNCDPHKRIIYADSVDYKPSHFNYYIIQFYKLISFVEWFTIA